MKTAKVTILNSMAGKDFEQALDQHRAWGIDVLDLKDAIFGKGIVELTRAEAERAANLIVERRLSVYCFSTGLFGGDIELGEDKFRKAYLDKMAHVLELAEILQPRLIRLLAAQTSRRSEVADSAAYIQENHSWLIPMYGEAIDRIHQAGFSATIENEVHNCIFSTVAEICDFFDALNQRQKLRLTWDVQNLWQMGVYPSMEVYRQLKPLIGYYHLKGGQRDGKSNKLRWRSGLADASWPVVEMTTAVVIDGVSPVICLNPSHGEAKEGYDYSGVTEKDLDFIRAHIPELR
jgi:sugar phosphate isomerase/epimerase